MNQLISDLMKNAEQKGWVEILGLLCQRDGPAQRNAGMKFTTHS